MMIDAMRGKTALPIPLPRPIREGTVIKLADDGEVVWETSTRLKVRGSFQAAIHIRAASTATLEFDGNPAKFLQGHNLYGPSDPKELLWTTFKRIEALPGVFPCSLADMGLYGPDTLAECTTLGRTDCTAMFQLDSVEDVLWFIKTSLMRARLRDRGESGLATPWYSKGTRKKLLSGATFGSRQGKSNTHRSWTFYSKGLDIGVHPLPEVMVTSDVLEYANRCLRAELRLERNYLAKSGLSALSKWTPETAGIEWSAMMERMVFEGDVGPDLIEQLPRNLRVVYAAWTTGADLRQLYSKSAFYRHRSAIEKLTGADISLPFSEAPKAEVVPLRRPIFDLNKLLVTSRPAWADEVDGRLRAGGAHVFTNAA